MQLTAKDFIYIRPHGYDENGKANTQGKWYATSTKAIEAVKAQFPDRKPLCLKDGELGDFLKKANVPLDF